MTQSFNQSGNGQITSTSTGSNNTYNQNPVFTQNGNTGAITNNSSYNNGTTNNYGQDIPKWYWALQGLAPLGGSLLSYLNGRNNVIF